MGDIFCEACSQNGLQSKKHLYQLNFEEAIFLCENKECPDLYAIKDVMKIIVPCSPSSSPKKQIELKKQLIASFNTPNINQQTNNTINATAPTNEMLTATFDRLVLEMQEPIQVDILNLLKKHLIHNIQNNSSQNQQFSHENVNHNVALPTELSNRITYVSLPNITFNTLQNYEQKSFNNSSLCNENVNHNNYVVSINNRIRSTQIPSKSVHFPNCIKYPHWFNKDSLCWLDVSLNILVHNKTLKKSLGLLSEESVIKKLCSVYDQALLSLNPSMQEEKTPSSNSANIPVTSTHTTFHMALSMLDKIRDHMFEEIQKKLRCLKGQDDSPVFALAYLLKETVLESSFVNHYQLVFKCESCNFQQTRSVQKILLSLEKVPEDFSLLNPRMVVTCFKCGALNQMHEIKFKKLSSCVMMHFINGLPVENLSRYDSEFSDGFYAVTALIQYKQNPNHFVAWIKDVKENKWLECDDLKPHPVCFCTKKMPQLQSKECHVVVWERIDTDKFLSSSNDKLLENKTSLSTDLENEIESFMNDHLYCSSSLNSSFQLNSPDKNDSFKEIEVPTELFTDNCTSLSADHCVNETVDESLEANTTSLQQVDASEIVDCNMIPDEINSKDDLIVLTESKINETIVAEKENLNNNSITNQTDKIVSPESSELYNQFEYSNPKKYGKIINADNLKDLFVSNNNEVITDSSNLNSNYSPIINDSNINENTICLHEIEEKPKNVLTQSALNTSTIDTCTNVNKDTDDSVGKERIHEDEICKLNNISERKEENQLNLINPINDSGNKSLLKNNLSKLDNNLVCNNNDDLLGNSEIQASKDKCRDFLSFSSSQYYLIVVPDKSKAVEKTEFTLENNDAVRYIQNYGQSVKTFILPDFSVNSSPQTLLNISASNELSTVLNKSSSSSLTVSNISTSKTKSVSEELPGKRVGRKRKNIIIEEMIGGNKNSNVSELSSGQCLSVTRGSKISSSYSSAPQVQKSYRRQNLVKNFTVKEEVLPSPKPLPKHLANLLNICVKNKASASSADDSSAKRTIIPPVSTFKKSRTFKGYQSKQKSGMN